MTSYISIVSIIHSCNLFQVTTNTKSNGKTKSPASVRKEAHSENSNDACLEAPLIPTRRSVRFKEKTEQKEIDTVKGKNLTDLSLKGKSKVNTKKDLPESLTDSVVVITDSEPMEIEEQDTENQVDNVVEVDKEKAKNDSKIEDNNCSSVDSQKDDIPEDKKATDKQNKIDSATSSSSSISSGEAVPQNVLGVLGFTQSTSSSKTDTSKSGDSAEMPKSVSGSSQCEENDVNSTSTPNDDSAKTDKEILNKMKEATCEVLSSWTQKLTQLSQSPKLSSQDLALSPKRSKSPYKSPRKNKKKVTDENEEKGALDKWVIRSPAKHVALIDDDKNTEELIEANLSLVEETQSPSKFFRSKEKQDGISPSIMETPPKAVLENIPLNHGNSNRKLFSSQESQLSVFSMVEDSNLVPASPNSKSFTLRPGTPVLKLKKLTETDIQKYSPSRKDKQNLNLTPSKRLPGKKSENTKPISDALSDGLNAWKKSSHEHDDFSEFTPFDIEKPEAVEDPLGMEKLESDEDFFSKSLTSTEKAMLKLDENKNDEIPKTKATENTGEKNAEVSCSEALFSEDINSFEHESQSGDILQSSQDSDSQADQTQKSQEVKDSSVTPGKGRKRKQITPKKMTPEESKRKRKAVSPAEGRRSARKTNSQYKHYNEKLKDDKNTSCSAIVDDEKSRSNEMTIVNDQEVEKTKAAKKNNVEDCVPSLRENIPKEAQKESLIEHKKDESNCESDINDTDQKKDEEKITQENMEVDEHENTSRSSLENTQENLTAVDTETVEKKGKKRGRRSLRSSLGIREESEKTANKKMQVEGSTVADTKEQSGIGVKENSDINDLKTEEKTPESKSVQKKQPGRRSTTKHKKEVAQKMINKRGKDVLVNDSDSNLDVEDQTSTEQGSAPEGIVRKLDENVNFTKTDNIKTTQSDELKIDDENNQETGETENKSISNKSKNSISSDSDDDVPLIQMSQNLSKREKQTKKSKSQISPTSPVANKLRSNFIKNTRLRSAEKKSTSPKAKKAVTLALKRTRGKNVKTTELKSLNKVAKSGDKDAESDDLKDNKDEQNTKSDSDVAGTASEERATGDVTEILTNGKSEHCNETPRKELEQKQASVASVLMMRNSDSKLVLGSRKFQKRSVIARRSILKTASDSPDGKFDSPVRSSEFHPITVNRIYSPTASPSASILKKRRLSGDLGPEACSPPAKVFNFFFTFYFEILMTSLLQPVEQSLLCNFLTGKKQILFH